MALPADFGPRVGVVLSASRLVLLAAIVVALVAVTVGATVVVAGCAGPPKPAA